MVNPEQKFLSYQDFALMSKFYKITSKNVFLPTPAPASSLKEPHSQATCRGRGSAQTTKEIVADSPLLTDTVCPFSELVRKTSGAPVLYFYIIPM